MPLVSLHLFALEDARTLYSLVKHIRSSSANVLVISKPIRWIIMPEKINAGELLSPKWDLLLILLDNQNAQDLVRSILDAKQDFRSISHFTLKTGVPSRLTSDFTTMINPRLLHPTSAPVKLSGALDKPIMQSSAQALTLSPELQQFVKNNAQSSFGGNAVSMLNLLAFNPGKKESYLKYGKAFAETIGKSRGGDAKLVGNIVYDSASNSNDKWDEFALAHYPSLSHFADMIASQDYQAVNQEYRVPALKDTCILFTSEIQLEALAAEQGQSTRESAKL